MPLHIAMCHSWQGLKIGAPLRQQNKTLHTQVEHEQEISKAQCLLLLAYMKSSHFNRFYGQLGTSITAGEECGAPIPRAC